MPPIDGRQGGLTHQFGGRDNERGRLAVKVLPARRLGVTTGPVVAALCAFVLVLGLAPAAVRADAAPTSAKVQSQPRERTFSPTPGLVRAPVLSHLTVHPTRQGGIGSASAISLDLTGSRVAVRRAVPYKTGRGQDVWVSVSTRYTENPRADRTLVRYVESLMHGDELAGLRLMVLRGDEISRKCGPGTAACYFSGTDTIVVVGEDRFGGLPTDYVLAHEYGHRIAQYRFNPPFRGGAFWNGPKRWYTHERICSKVKRGVLSLGRNAYWDFPGENFAEAYAQMHMSGQVRWQYAPSLRPDRRSFEAIRRDIESPWLGSKVRDIRVTLPPYGEARYSLRTPLDGRLTADLYGLNGARFGFELSRGSRRLARAPRPTRDFRLSKLICGERQLRVTVRAGARGGSYRLVIARP